MMALVRILAVFACTLALAHPAAAASCDLEALLTQIGNKIGDGQKGETWFNLYSQQFGAVMQAANAGDMDTACEKAQDLSEWVDRNPPQ